MLNDPVPASEVSMSESRASGYRVALEELPPLAELGRAWTDLDSRAQGSFFTSWTWIGTWLSMLPGYIVPQLLIARSGETPVAMAILCQGPRSRFSMERMHLLNQTGHPEFDSIYIEYNDVLVDRAHPDARLACLLALTNPKQPPVYASACTSALATAFEQTARPHEIVREEVCAYIDLTRQVVGGDDLDSLLMQLGRNTRQQCRRAMRLFAQSGPLRVSPAVEQDADSVLNKLVSLHQSAWTQRKGLPGAFANPFLTSFISRLVERGIPSHSVDLLQVTAGDKTIGVLLNFLHSNDVYSYQSGFAYSDDNRLKPGLVSHVLAAAHYRQRGYRSYHFMAGTARYKTTLSNATETLTWLKGKSHTVLGRMEAQARAMWKILRHLRSPMRGH